MVHLKSFMANNNNTNNNRKRKQKIQINELSFQLKKFIWKANESQRKQIKNSGRGKKQGRREGDGEREGGKKEGRKMIKKSRNKIEVKPRENQ